MGVGRAMMRKIVMDSENHYFSISGVIDNAYQAEWKALQISLLIIVIIRPIFSKNERSPGPRPRILSRKRGAIKPLILG